MPFQLKPIHMSTLLKQSSSEEIARVRYDYQEDKRLKLIQVLKQMKQNLDI